MPSTAREKLPRALPLLLLLHAGLGAVLAAGWAPLKASLVVGDQTFSFEPVGAEMLDVAFKRFMDAMPGHGDPRISLARQAVRQAVEEGRIVENWVQVQQSVECVVPVFFREDASPRIHDMLSECGAGDAMCAVESLAKELRHMPLVRLDVFLPGHAQPLTFRLWEGERLAEAVPAFLAGAGAGAAAADRVALLRRAEHEVASAGLMQPPPAHWRLAASYPRGGDEPDQVFCFQEDLWLSEAGANDVALNADFGIVFLHKHPFCNGHYYHIMECLLGLYAWTREYGPGREPLVVVVDPSSYNARLHDFFVSALFPGAVIVTEGRVHLFAAVVASKDGIGANPPLSAARLNKHLEHSVGVVGAWFPEFLAAVHAAAGASPRPRPASPGEVRAVYVRRAMSLRELGDEDLARLASVMLEEHGVALEVVRFEAMTVEEQVRLSARVDLMVGVHGNGLTNLLWMPPHGAVLELFAADWHFYDYQMLSEISGHLYSGVQEGNPHPYRRGSRRESVYGMQTFGPTSLDWELVSHELAFLLARIMACCGGPNEH